MQIFLLCIIIGFRTFQGKSADGGDHRFQHIVRTLTGCLTAKVINPTTRFDRKSFDVVSAQLVLVVRNNEVHNIKVF